MANFLDEDMIRRCKRQAMTAHPRYVAKHVLMRYCISATLRWSGMVGWKKGVWWEWFRFASFNAALFITVPLLFFKPCGFSVKTIFKTDCNQTFMKHVGLICVQFCTCCACMFHFKPVVGIWKQNILYTCTIMYIYMPNIYFILRFALRLAKNWLFWKIEKIQAYAHDMLQNKTWHRLYSGAGVNGWAGGANWHRLYKWHRLYAWHRLYYKDEQSFLVGCRNILSQDLQGPPPPLHLSGDLGAFFSFWLATSVFSHWRASSPDRSSASSTLEKDFCWLRRERSSFI